MARAILMASMAATMIWGLLQIAASAGL